ncbi:MAG: hypothetical protein A2020_12590 [Lentisphaerae bacterium GWF2_45_14]|nr:MAG: hypothetical protein A2020_12590 [Lentisphaerae bacterium GWF2_45_14]
MNKEDYLKPLVDERGRELLPCRIVPSPMEGVMTDLFCRTMIELKLTDCWISPFIRISNAVPGIKSLKGKIRRFTESGLPLTVQIMGNDPSFMAGTAKELASLGVKGININLACPSKTVLKNNSGGALLKKIPLMKEIITAVKDGAGGLPVSVKIRSGFSSISETPLILDALLEVAPAYVIFHFRTVAEEYEDVPDGLKRTYRAVKFFGEIPLIASGDIFSVADASSTIAATGCAGLAAGRGLLKNPFLIREILESLDSEKIFQEKSHEEKAALFFMKTLDLARENPSRYWNRSSIIESARNLWGVEHPFFKKLLSMTDKEILASLKDLF